MSAPHLIFDLGAVLYRIDFNVTIAAFEGLMDGAGTALIHEAVRHHPAWLAYERGQIDTPAFRDAVRSALHLDAPDADIDAAWNALLLGPIPGRAELLADLARRHRLVLLSNTNALHFAHLLPQCRDLFQPLERLFLSFEMGHRKPEAAIYQRLLGEMDWKAEQCLFFDDSAENVAAAKQQGMAAEVVENGKSNLLNVLRERSIL